MSWIVGTAHAMGAAPQGGGAAGGDMFTQLMPFALIFVVFYFLLIRPQQKKAKEQKQMLEALKPGDTVITVGGMYGKIVETEGDIVVVDLGDTKVRMGRAYIAGTQDKRQAPPAAKKDGKKLKKVEKKAEPVVEETVSGNDDDNKPAVQ